MDKPLSIKRVEFAEKIAKVINESELPACVVLDVLQIITAQVNELTAKQLEQDRELWRQQLLEESKEE